mmetsp:Transcript_31208/g.100767  ORF Transcript_31208/g.100767 Transcript_31208/m.100767 type:complete len:222 (+) Transcript_31208:1711-2376(+)
MAASAPSSPGKSGCHPAATRTRRWPRPQRRPPPISRWRACCSTGRQTSPPPSTRRCAAREQRKESSSATPSALTHQAHVLALWRRKRLPGDPFPRPWPSTDPAAPDLPPFARLPTSSSSAMASSTMTAHPSLTRPPLEPLQRRTAPSSRASNREHIPCRRCRPEVLPGRQMHQGLDVGTRGTRETLALVDAGYREWHEKRECRFELDAVAFSFTPHWRHHP